MLTATQLSQAPRCLAFTAMTFRVYLRWPGQRVSDKTTTDNRAVAELAFKQLVSRAADLAAQGAVGISFTENGQQIEYHRFSKEAGDPRGQTS